MKKLTIFLSFVCILFCKKIILANPYQDLSKTCEKLNQEPNIVVFNNTKIYKNNGALLGLIKEKIDLAIIKKDFLFEIQDLEEKGFWIVKNGKKYNLISRQKLKKSFENKPLDKIIEILGEI